MAQKQTYPLILIVDDDPVLRKALQEIFEFSHYAVVAAASAQEGLEILRQSFDLPSLIVSDMIMPGLDGFQFMQAVYAEEKWRTIPFIFLSGKPRSKLGEVNKQLVRYIPKPFLVEDLLAEVSNVLDTT